MSALHSKLSILTLVFLVAACASSGTGSGRAPGSRDVLTQEQMRTAGYTNVFEAVRALRSSWLVPRGPDSFTNQGQVQVYWDNTRLGGVDQLQGIGTTQIAYVQYYDGITASGRWGLDHGHGVIFVSTLPR